MIISKTCIDCIHLDIAPGEDGYYPGEHTPITIQCGRQVWVLDNEDNRETVLRHFRTAGSCELFELDAANAAGATP